MTFIRNYKILLIKYRKTAIFSGNGQRSAGMHNKSQINEKNSDPNISVNNDIIRPDDNYDLRGIAGQIKIQEAINTHGS